MRRLCAAFTILLGLANAALAQGAFPVPSNEVTIAGTVAAITRIVQVPAQTPSKQIIVTHLRLVPVATSVVTFSYGTGTNCGTNTTVIEGPLTFNAGQTINAGDGNGPVLILPPGVDLCITVATAAAPGSLIYTLLP